MTVQEFIEKQPRVDALVKALFQTAAYNNEHGADPNVPNNNVCLFTDDKEIQDFVKKGTPYDIEQICAELLYIVSVTPFTGFVVAEEGEIVKIL